MNQEWVTVTDVEQEGIWVESLQRSACDSCNARNGCGQRTLSQLGHTIKLWVPTRGSYQLGQQVLLELPSGGLALSALLLYGLPLFGLIVGAVVGQLFNELVAIGFGVLGLAAGLLLGRLSTQKNRHLWQPTIQSTQSPCIETKIID